MKNLFPLFLVAAGLAVAGCNKTDNGSMNPPSSSSSTPGAPSPTPPAADTNTAAAMTNNPPVQ